MICKNCGHKNGPLDKFCGNCGKRLKDNKDSQTERLDRDEIDRSLHGRMTIPKKEKRPSILPYIILGLGLIALALGFLAIKKSSSKKAPQEQAQTYEKSPLEEDLDFAQKAADEGKYGQAVRLLRDIPKDKADAYRKAQKLISAIEDRVVTDLRGYFDSGDYTTAKNLAGSYLEIFPESQDIWKIREKSEEILAANEAKRREEEAREAKEDEITDPEELKKNNSYGQNGAPYYTEVYSPKDFLGKSLIIDTKEGQLRRKPDINSKIVGKVKESDEVYVYDVKKSGDRYWLDIGEGWISSRLVTGEFSESN